MKQLFRKGISAVQRREIALDAFRNQQALDHCGYAPKQYGAQLVSEERRIFPEIDERHCWLLNNLDDGWIAQMGTMRSNCKSANALRLSLGKPGVYS